MDIAFGDLHIRDAVPDDAGQLCTWWNDGVVMAHAGFPQGLGIAEASIAAKLCAQTDANRIHMILENSRPIGEMNYRDMGDRVCEIGIKICESSAQNRGLGKIILRLFIERLFSECGYEKIRLDTDLKNTRAQHVYERIGFRRIRVCHDSWKDQAGNMRSSVDYELTKEEFASFFRE